MLKKKFTIFAFFILLSFALLTYHSVKGESRLFDFPLYPLKFIEQTVTTVIKSVRTVVNTYFLIVGKEEENKKLLEIINRNEEDKNRYIEKGLENERLRKLLQLTSERPDYIATAEVFARDPTNWFQMLWVNKGTNDDITKDMVAVTPLGPVGRVHRVFLGGANIILITDVNSSVAVRLQSSRVEGILEGRGDDRCYLKYISKESEVKVGDRVITSGLEGIYPEGLLIGYVQEVTKDDEEVFQLIEVLPSQNMKTVEEVAILKR